MGTLLNGGSPSKDKWYLIKWLHVPRGGAGQTAAGETQRKGALWPPRLLLVGSLWLGPRDPSPQLGACGAQGAPEVGPEGESGNQS